MKWTLLTLVLSFSSLCLGTSSDPVVAKVNGKEITKSTLMAYHQQNLNLIQSRKKVSLQNSLNDLIDRIIGIQNAKKAKMHTKADVVKKMNDVVYHAYISEELTPLLKQIKVTDAEIKDYYSKYPEYKTSQILLRLRTNPSPEDVATAMQMANKIYVEAKKNVQNFPSLAKKYGQTTTALAGGDMGYQPKVRLSPEYYEAIKGRKINSVTNPFRSQYGIHIVLVTGKKEFKQIDKNLYKKILYDSKKQDVLSKYFSRKRAEAKLTINKEALK